MNIKHLVHFIRSANDLTRFLESKRLRTYPRYVPGNTRLLGQRLQFADAASLLSTYKSIFERGIYDFIPGHRKPVILDCGANIGMATLYWKQHYPDAQITAFEADPQLFKILQRNCAAFQLRDVELVNKAVWCEEIKLTFQQERADAGRIVGQEHDKQADVSTISVDTVRLRNYLKSPVDLLKLDIEGAETEVLLDCCDVLKNVQFIFVEFHSFVAQEQRLDEILQILRQADLRYHLQPELVASKPFIHRLNDLDMDQRLNIFAYRA